MVCIYFTNSRKRNSDMVESVTKEVTAQREILSGMEAQARQMQMAAAAAGGGAGIPVS